MPIERGVLHVLSVEPVILLGMMAVVSMLAEADPSLEVLYPRSECDECRLVLCRGNHTIGKEHCLNDQCTRGLRNMGLYEERLAAKK